MLNYIRLDRKRLWPIFKNYLDIRGDRERLLEIVSELFWLFNCQMRYQKVRQGLWNVWYKDLVTVYVKHMRLPAKSPNILDNSLLLLLLLLVLLLLPQRRIAH